MIICFIVDNFELLWPMLHFAIKGKYGHLRLTTDQFREKERLGTLTDREREEYFEPGPFSMVTYLEHLMRPGFYGEEICLLIISMMWKIRIIIINGQTLKPIKIRNRNPAKKADMCLCIVIMHTIFFFMSFSLFFPCINVKHIIVLCAIPPCFILAVQEYDAEDSGGNVTKMWYVLKVEPLESNPGFSLRQEDPEVYSDGGEDDRDG